MQQLTTSHSQVEQDDARTRRLASVAIARCGDYELGAVQEAVREAVELAGGMNNVIRHGDTVLLKANLLAPADPDEAVTTHPAVARAVAQLVLEAGGIPIIADSPGFFFAGGKCQAARKCGMSAVGEELGFEVTQFEAVETPFLQVGVPGGVMLRTVYAARLALEADVIITLPKLKTHASTWYSGAVKNMFGCVAARTRKEAHRLGTYGHFSAALVDVYATFRDRTRLAVMDAVIGMEGTGPRHGTPRHVGAIMASRDPVALDAIAAQMIGYDGDDILTTRLAAERGFGVAEQGGIDIVGEPMERMWVDFEKPSGRRVGVPSMVARMADRLIKVRPEVNRDLCDNCSICARSCPADAIAMDGWPHIDRDQCIECFCCNETCPTAAMEITRNWLARRLA